MNRSDKFIDIVFKAEGFYSNDIDDSGGETLYGIARNKNPKWLGWKIVDEYKTKSNFPNNMKKDGNLIALKNTFYTEIYAKPCKIDEFDNELLALHVFDFAVNAGMKTAIKTLQKIVGTFQDGIIGSKTIKAANAKENALELFILARKAYYIKIAVGKNAKYKNGWLNRVDNINKSLK